MPADTGSAAPGAPAPPFRGEGRRNRALALAGAAAALAALFAVLWMLFGGQERDRQPPPAAASPPTVASPALPEQAQVAYAAPNGDRVARAYADVGRVYRTGGASELARTSRACFEHLQAAPSYGLLDYCLAFDAFAAAVMRRLSGDADILPASSWFGQAPQRGLQTAQALMGPQGDGSARLLDIRRLALQAARSGSGRRPPAAEPRRQAEAQAVEPPTVVAAVEAPPTRPTAPPAQRTEPPRTAQRPPVPAPPAPRPAPQPRDYAEAPARRDPTARPSFSCRSARTRSERLVCGNADLARLDRELNRAYEDAVASGVPRRGLRREQDSWLSVRESAAGDPDAVAEIYELRIEELRDMSGDY